MKHFFLTLTAMTLFFVISCNSANNDHKTEMNASSTEDTTLNLEGLSEHNSRNSLDWGGTYEGIIPCADCPGIKMSMTLNTDGTFAISQTYLERDVQPFEEKGTFEWLPDGNHITIKSGDMVQQYKVGENFLMLMDNSDENAPAKALENYKLVKKMDKGGML